jgi:hypothetical protein
VWPDQASPSTQLGKSLTIGTPDQLHTPTCTQKETKTPLRSVLRGGSSHSNLGAAPAAGTSSACLICLIWGCCLSPRRPRVVYA